MSDKGVKRVLIAGSQFAFGVLIVLTFSIVYCIQIARSGGKIPTFRRIPGIEAVPEAIGRAAEMGRPVMYNPGIAGLTTDTAAQTYAALEVLAYVGQLCAKYDTELIVTIRNAEVLPVAEEVVMNAYVAAGKADQYSPDSVRYISPFQFGYVSGVLGMIEREKPAAYLLLGAFWSESPSYIEAANGVGALQIGGTANLHQIQFLVAGCDYTLIGEELFAAGAYVADNRAKLGSIWGQDIGKIVAVLLIVVGSISAWLKSDWLTKLVSK